MCGVFTVSADPSLEREVFKLAPPCEVQRDFWVTYPGQVPNICFWLISGGAILENEGRETRVGPGGFVGVAEVCQRIPSETSVRILEDSKVVFIDRQVLMPLLKSEHPSWKRIAQQLGVIRTD